MKTLQNKIIASALVVGVLALATIFTLLTQQKRAVGSVAPGGEYRSVTLPVTASNTQLCNQDATLQQAPGVLGSVFITSYGTGELLIVDATTTNNNLRVSVATTSITKFHAPIMATSSWSGVDINFQNGIIVVARGTVGTTTITYRCVF